MLGLVIHGIVLFIAIIYKLLLPFALIYFVYYLFVKKRKK